MYLGYIQILCHFISGSWASIMKPNLSLLTSMQRSQSTDTGLWWMKVQCVLQTPSKEYGQLMLKSPRLPDGFQRSVFKGKVKESIAGCVISSFTILWLIERKKVTVSILRLQWAWGLCVHGHHAVNFFYLVVVLISVKQLRNVHQTLLSTSFRKELKILL